MMPRAWPLSPTDNEVMLYQYWKGGRNRERNRHIPRTSPPAFCTEAKVAKGGAYLRDTMVEVQLTPFQLRKVLVFGYYNNNFKSVC